MRLRLAVTQARRLLGACVRGRVKRQAGGLQGFASREAVQRQFVGEERRFSAGGVGPGVNQQLGGKGVNTSYTLRPTCIYLPSKILW